MIAANPLLPEMPEASLPAEEWADWLLSGLGAAIDAAMARAMSIVVDAALMPAAEQVPALRAAAQPYLASDLQREPQRFFDFLQSARSIRMVSERYRGSLDRGVIVARQFLSDYRPYHEPHVDTYESCPENERVPLQHWMHDVERPKGTVLALHGFSMGQPRFDAFGMMASEWYRRGLDVALLTLPYHGARTPKRARFSGELFASPDPGRLNEAVRQAVSDVHRIVAWLRHETQAPVGLLGLSLGGYVSSLMAGLTDDIDFVVPMVPPACLADLAFRFLSRSSRSDMEPFLGPEEQRALYRIHSPLTFPLKVEKKRVLIVAGRGDRIVPPEHPYALWKHWGEPAIHWFSGSHLAPFRRQRIAEVIAEHLRGLGIL